MQPNEMSSLVKRIHDEFSRKAFIDLATIENEEEGLSQLNNILNEHTNLLPATDRDRIRDEYFELGPLKTLMDDPEVTEIIVNGPESVWYEKSGRIFRHDDMFLSQLTFSNVIRRVCRQSEIQVTLAHPYASGTWRKFRIQIVGPPISKEFILTMRSRPENPWTFDRLLERSWCTEKQFQTIRALVESRSNFLVVGPTGAGKTSVLNACLRLTNPQERIVILEDTDELETPNETSVKLLTRCDPDNLLPQIDLSVLLRHSLRLRPDRLVLGEVRGPEAKDLLMTLATGHSGSLGTLHAANAQEALLRLEMLIQLGAPQWAQWTVRRLIQLSLQHIIVTGKRDDGKRVLEGIFRLSSLEDFGFLVEKIG
ncbi:MAG: ATPase, T2SS/T4P/T4SS family [Bdellovibrionia bacterium]